MLELDILALDVFHRLVVGEGWPAIQAGLQLRLQLLSAEGVALVSPSTPIGAGVTKEQPGTEPNLETLCDVAATQIVTMLSGHAGQVRAARRGAGAWAEASPAGPAPRSRSSMASVSVDQPPSQAAAAGDDTALISDWLGRYEGAGEMAGQGLDGVLRVRSIVFVVTEGSASLSVLIATRGAVENRDLRLQIPLGAETVGRTLTGTERLPHGSRTYRLSLTAAGLEGVIAKRGRGSAAETSPDWFEYSFRVSRRQYPPAATGLGH